MLQNSGNLRVAAVHIQHQVTDSQHSLENMLSIKSQTADTRLKACLAAANTLCYPAAPAVHNQHKVTDSSQLLEARA